MAGMAARLTRGRLHRLPSRAALLAGAVVLVALALSVRDPAAILLVAVNGVTGAILVARRSTNRVGWLLVLTAAGFNGAIGHGVTLPELELLVGGTAPPDLALRAWLTAMAIPLTFGCLLALAIVFPDGRLPGGRARTWVALAIVPAAAVCALVAFGPVIPLYVDDVGMALDPPNPAGLLAPLPVWDLLTPRSLVAAEAGLLLLAAAILILRYRHATGTLRLQLRWVVAAIVLVAICFAVGLGLLVATSDTAGGAIWIPAVLAFALVPVAIGVAALRYRLYGIDTVINRAIVWVLLTAILAGASSLVVGIAGQVFASLIGGDPAFSALISTLVVVGAFDPVKMVCQEVVDRRFAEARVPGHELDTLVAEVTRSIAPLDPARTWRRFLHTAVASWRAEGGLLTVSAGDAPVLELETGDGGRPDPGDGAIAATATGDLQTVTLVLAGPAADADPGRLSTALARVLAELEEDARAAR